MKQYTVTTPDELRSLCIKNDWFTCGTCRQYEKLFQANEERASLDEIATIIWICSDEKWCRRDILVELNEAMGRYENMLYYGNEKGEL